MKTDLKLKACFPQKKGGNFFYVVQITTVNKVKS